MSRRDLILAEVSDLATTFVYYDRKGDEVLGLGEIQQAIAAGEVSVDEIVGEFRESLLKGLQDG